MEKSLQKVNDFWSKREPAVDAGSFISSPITRPYIIANAYGEDYVDEHKNSSSFGYDLFFNMYLREGRIESILSLCCGFGAAERWLVSKMPGVQECLGLDVAEGAIRGARQKAKDLKLTNIRYEVANINNFAWEHCKYDLVVANGALHHLQNLEDVVYGASTKGNTVLQYYGLDHTLMIAAAERNPDKWGKLTEGTRIPIGSGADARAAKPDYFLVLPWHFSDESQAREREYLLAGGRFILPAPYFELR